MKILIILLIVFNNVALYSQTILLCQRDTIEEFSWGMPYDDTPDDDYILIRQGYSISYNPNNNALNWSMHLQRPDDYGKSKRYAGQFIKDSVIEAQGFYSVSNKDYKGSEYDKGHSVRSLDRTASNELNKETFILSSIVPQSSKLNRNIWLKAENFYMNKVEQGKQCLVIVGGIYNNDNWMNNSVNVPSSYYMILIFMKVNCVDNCFDNDNIYAYIFPNNNNVTNIMEDYETTIADVELKSGYQFIRRGK